MIPVDRPMRTDDFDYELPPELIAQAPLPRGDSRLMVLGKTSGSISHRVFQDLPEFLRPGDVLVLNDTRVSARRLFGVSESGRECEVLLLRPVGPTDWEALVRPGKKLRTGSRIHFEIESKEEALAEVVQSTPEGGRRLRFPNSDLRDELAQAGNAPLPPYIHQSLEDEERYQTVYSRSTGS